MCNIKTGVLQELRQWRNETQLTKCIKSARCQPVILSFTVKLLYGQLSSAVKTFAVKIEAKMQNSCGKHA